MKDDTRTTLVLVPTAFERDLLEREGPWFPPATVAALCGFGPVVAAARTTLLLARLRPARVLLVGIAGGFAAHPIPVGGACEFESVVLEGVGVGQGAAHVPSSRLAFSSGRSEASAGGLAERIGEHLSWSAASGPGRQLLTVCAASGSAGEAADRGSRFPSAAAEDMEGFAVALACALQGVALCIVRGVSNRVGERDRGAWRSEDALAAARALARAKLASGEAWRVPRAETIT
mgnify:CR=1 FL=1